MQIDLQLLKDSLLRGLRVELGPKDGDLAFERHILLAVRFHSAAGLNQTQTGETAGWKQYFVEHVPEPIGWASKDADLLWTRWRIGLVKHETPLRGISLTHGQPQAHWYREPDGTLCINLESMWDAFELSVESFISLLEDDDERRDLAVSRWQERAWTVRSLVVPPPVPYPFADTHAVTAVSATTISIPLPKQER